MNQSSIEAGRRKWKKMEVDGEEETGRRPDVGVPVT